MLRVWIMKVRMESYKYLYLPLIKGKLPSKAGSVFPILFTFPYDSFLPKIKSKANDRKKTNEEFYIWKTICHGKNT